MSAGEQDTARLGPRYPIAGVRYRSDDAARRYLASGDWIDGNIGDAVRDAARAVPNKLAIVDGESSLTFADIDRLSESVAASLLDLGLVPGDRALFQLGTTADYFTAFFGCIKAGIVPVATLPQYRRIEMRHFAARTGARAIFVQADVDPHFDQVALAVDTARAVPALAQIIVARGTRNGLPSLAAMAQAYSREDARDRIADISPRPLDVAIFQLSGGSTSLPKIIPRMHGEYMGATRLLGRRYALTPDDVTLWGLPLVHNAGTLFAVLPVAVERRTLVLQPRLDIRHMLYLVERYGVTFTGSIGPVAARLLEIDDLDRYDIASLRQFFALSGAAAVEAHVGIPVGQMFGMTEGMVFAAAPTDPTAVRHGTIGYPVSPADQVRLLDPDSEEDMPFGEIGELAFRGPHTLTGYFGDDAATAAAFTTDGFCRAGDLMRAHAIDDRTCYSFEGRIKDNINRGGEKIGAEEVETLICRHPDVADARVVAMPDPEFGEKVCAFVIAQPGRASPGVASLGSFLLEQGVAKYKLPERVYPIAAFPLTKVGKADKAALRTMIATRLADETKQAISR